MNGPSLPSHRLLSAQPDSVPASELAIIREELCRVLHAAFTSLGERPGTTAAETVALWRTYSPRFAECLEQRGWKREQADAVTTENDRLADMLQYVIALQSLTTKEALWESIAENRLHPASSPSRPQIALL